MSLLDSSFISFENTIEHTLPTFKVSVHDLDSNQLVLSVPIVDFNNLESPVSFPDGFITTLSIEYIVISVFHPILTENGISIGTLSESCCILIVIIDILY